jgi:epoxyqueuosine reductase QueG
VPDSELLAGLRRAVLDAGFDLFGVTSAEPLEVDDENPWGHSQPRQILPSARSVVLAGFSIRYEPRVVPSELGTPRGRFTPGGSRVFEQMEGLAWQVVIDYLAALGFAAVSAPQMPIKPAIVRSGLGRYGKHCVTITPELGSMVMWGAVVTDAPLADGSAGQPIRTEQCPTDCMLCVEACPTGALLGDYALNRSRCITFWLWGSNAPADLRHHQQDRLFGCGECLLACPANERVPVRLSYPIADGGASDSAELIPFVAGDMEHYDRVMPKFPRQAGAQAIRGNATIALGNSGDPAGLDALRTALQDPDPQLREYAAWAIERIEQGRR